MGPVAQPSAPGIAEERVVVGAGADSRVGDGPSSLAWSGYVTTAAGLHQGINTSFVAFSEKSAPALLPC